MRHSLELLSSILNFGGGFVLVLDALTIKQRVRVESTQRELQAAAKERGINLEAPGGQPLSTEVDLLLWLSNRSLRWARFGFGTMCLGFLLDFIAKLLG